MTIRKARPDQIKEMIGMEPEELSESLRVLADKIKKDMSASSIVMIMVRNNEETVITSDGDEVAKYALTCCSSEDLQNDMKVILKALASLRDGLLEETLKNIGGEALRKALLEALAPKDTDGKTVELNPLPGQKLN